MLELDHHYHQCFQGDVAVMLIQLYLSRELEPVKALAGFFGVQHRLPVRIRKTFRTVGSSNRPDVHCCIESSALDKTYMLLIPACVGLRKQWLLAAGTCA